MSNQMKSRSGRTIKVTDKVKALLEESDEKEATKRRRALAKQMKLLAESEEEASVLHQKLKQLEIEKKEMEDVLTEETKDLDEHEITQYVDYFDDDVTLLQQSEDRVRKRIDSPSEHISKMGQPFGSSTMIQVSSGLESSQNQYAELEARKDLMLCQAALEDERFRLEQQRRELERREKMLLLENEMNMTRARMTGAHSLDPSQLMSIPIAQDTASQGNEVQLPLGSAQGISTPNKKDQLSSSMNNSRETSALEERLEGAFSRLAGALEQAVSRPQHLVRIEPAIFKGDTLEFSHWLSAFEDLVEEVRVSRRLSYLKKYVQGPAYKAIEHLMRLEPEKAYQQAMQKLKERYNSNFRVYEAYRDKLEDWPFVKDGDGAALREYSDFLASCLSAKDQICYLSVLDDYSENVKLTKKISRKLLDKWSTKVDDWVERHGGEGRDFPPFSVYVEFISRQARIECGPIKSALSKRDNQQSQQGQYPTNKNTRTARVNTTEGMEMDTELLTTSRVNWAQASNEKADVKCLFCEGRHELSACSKFQKIPEKERHVWSRKVNICKRCLNIGHYMSGCTSQVKCKKCNKWHHTIFHDDNYQAYMKMKKKESRSRGEVTSAETVPATAPAVESASTNSVRSGPDDAALILPVYIRDGQSSSDSVMVYAILDGQSDSCFVSRSLADKLKAKGTRTSLHLKTMAGETVEEVDKLTDLYVKSMDSQTDVRLPKTYAHDVINAVHDQIAGPEDARQWEHLEEIASELHPVDRNVEIGLLLGRNCSKLIKPRVCIPGEDDDPYAIQTRLGWGVIGSVSGARKEGGGTSFVNITASYERPMGKINRMFQIEYSENESEKQMSQEDKRFIDQMEKGIEITKEGKIQLPLPLKDQEPMPNNRQQALVMLEKLKVKLLADQNYHQQYTKFMMEMIALGYAELAPDEYEPGELWYVTHHGVPHETKDLRVVFNCSLKYRGVSLNQKLLQGPDMTNNLTGVFCRFRKTKKVFKCDIRKMFYQVLVSEGHRDYLRFFYWPDGDLSQPPKEYRMRVHLFGATSSPGCANYALKKTAEMYGSEFHPKTVQFIRENFYVDDGLGGDQDVAATVRLANESHELCARSGFDLVKFDSNDPEVLAQIPEQRRAAEVKDLDMDKSDAPEKTLGVWTSLREDKILFRTNLKDKPETRRGVLSTVSSVYDPLGLVAPFVLTGKKILQDVCAENKDWDAPLSGEQKKRYRHWIKQLPELEDIQIDRSFLDQDFEEPCTIQLHHCADASMDGHGTASYVRVVDKNGKVKVSLAMAKARVPPTKSTTIPRRELVAAVAAVRVARFQRSSYSTITLSIISTRTA